MIPEEFCIRLIDLPFSIKAMVVLDEEGFPNIYVNSHLSYEEQKKAVQHEFKHILRNDAYNQDSIFAIES